MSSLIKSSWMIMYEKVRRRIPILDGFVRLGDALFDAWPSPESHGSRPSLSIFYSQQRVRKALLPAAHPTSAQAPVLFVEMSVRIRRALAKAREARGVANAVLT